MHRKLAMRIATEIAGDWFDALRFVAWTLTCVAFTCWGWWIAPVIWSVLHFLLSAWRLLYWPCILDVKMKRWLLFSNVKLDLRTACNAYDAMTDFEEDHQYFSFFWSAFNSDRCICCSFQMQCTLWPPWSCCSKITLARFFRYLTNYFPGLDRFPISFRSICRGVIHRHVVLALHHNGQYGCIGMSRRDDLMHKPITFEVTDILIYS